MDVLRVGIVLRPQGVAGQLKVDPMTDDPGRFRTLKRVYIEQDGFAPVDVLDVSVREGGVYLALAGCTSREAAEKYRGKHLCILREDAAKLTEGQYFIVDLLGCAVFDTDGVALGVLTDVRQYGAADVYEISGERNVQVPALKRLLDEVDVAHKRIVLDKAVLREVAVYGDE